MPLFEDFVSDDDVGITHTQFETAIQVWSWMQGGETPPTVGQAAAAFNTSVAIVSHCVETAAWMFLGGPDDDPAKQTIEHDGE